MNTTVTGIWNQVAPAVTTAFNGLTRHLQTSPEGQKLADATRQLLWTFSQADVLKTPKNILLTFFRSENRVVRSAVAEAFKNIPVYETDLLPLLEDSHSDVVQFAINLLERPSELAQRKLRELLRHADWEVRMAAAALLVKQNDPMPEAESVLLGFLRTVGNHGQRILAAEALSDNFEVLSDNAKAETKTLLETYLDKEVRKNDLTVSSNGIERIARALVKMGQADAVRNLLNNPRVSIVTSAAKALGKPVELGTKEALTTFLANKDQNLIYAAIETMKELNLREAESDLVSLSQRDPLFKLAVAIALTKIDGVSEEAKAMAKQILLKNLHQPEALNLIGDLGLMEAKPGLIQILQQQPDISLVYSAIAALAKLGETTAIEKVLEIKDQPLLVMAAAKVLGNPVKETTRDILLGFLDPSNSTNTSTILQYAIAAVKNLNIREAELALLGLLEHKNERVRASAIEALGQLGGSRTKTALSKLMDPSQDPALVIPAALSLARLNGDIKQHDANRFAVSA